MKLEEIKPEHIEPIRLWRNAQMDILRQNKPIQKKEQIEYFEKEVWSQKGQPYRDKELFSVIIDNSLLGYGGITNISSQNFRGEISFLLDPKISEDDVHYSVLFLEFLKLIEEFAIKELKIHKLFTETYAFRSKHILALEKFGFKLEGILSDHIFIKDKFIDSLIHGKILY